MAGVRLHHPTLRAQEGKKLTYVVELPQPHSRMHDCPTCSTPERKVQHSNKSIHLDLDAHGDVIVSHEVLASLEPAFYGGFEFSNEVAKPPPLSIGAVEMTKRQIVEAPLNTDAKVADFYVPGRTKYESRDRMQRALAEALRKEG